MLVELISKNAGAEQEHRQYYPSPSKVGQCIRALTYHAIGAERRPFPDRAMLVFEDGHWHEELIKDHIRKTVYELIEMKGSKQRITIADIDGDVMDGEVDGLLKDPLGVIYLLEIKSINPFGFQRLKDGPEDGHRRQSNLYMHGLIKSGLEISKAVVLYKNKATAAMKEFIIDYDKEQALSDIDMFKKVSRWAKSNTVPPRQYDRDRDWQCGYCVYSDICYENYESEFKALKTGADLPEDLVTQFKYYLEVSGHRLELEKEEKNLKQDIKDRLKSQDIREGRVGEYTAKLTMISSERIDKKLVPQEILPTIMKTSSYEKLTIRKIKEIV